MARPRKIQNPRDYPDVIVSAETGREMRRGIKMRTITVGGFKYRYPQPGWWADADDPNDHDGQLVDRDNEIHDLAVREARALAKGARLTPLQIRTIRERCGLTQREAAAVFGGGAKAFEKYESGDVLPSGAMIRLLDLAARRPDLFRKPPKGGPRRPAAEDVAVVQETLRRASVDRIVDRLKQAGLAPKKELERA
jgi:HTH-type transcriptional regulator/antitoxin MqsA